MSKNSRSTTIHLLLQGKGGVGKSLVATLLAQYFTSRLQSVRCIDIDPLAQTLAQYDRLNVQTFPVIREGDVDPRSFDAVIETLLNGSGTFVIDTGPSTFIPLWHYILEHDLMTTLNSSGRCLYIHYVIISGHTEDNALRFLRHLAESLPSRSIVLWINEFFGPVDADDIELLGKAGRILGSVAVPNRNRDIADLLVRKQTFDEALESSQTFTLTKRRLETLRNQLFAQLDRLPMGMQKERAA